MLSPGEIGTLPLAQKNIKSIHSSTSKYESVPLFYALDEG
jgi:hypothetical protein